MPASTARPDAATARYQATYHGRPDQVAMVRAAVAAHLADCPVTDDAVLVVSEIATNAIRHSGSAGEFFAVRVYRHRSWVWVECEDLGGPWHGQADEERPHGLSIVDALAEEWGVDGGTSGRVVWARLTW
jgi:anti-sigma regulatory factor (Ser/Thr protein kinase)